MQDVYTGEQIPLSRLTDTYIGSFCGIAAPESFEDGLRKLGARIELAKRFTDHHRYSEAELQSFINRCIRRDVDMIVTTEKDAVRFPRLTKPEVPIYFLRVEILILSGHETWEHCVGAHLSAAADALARAIFLLKRSTKRMTRITGGSQRSPNVLRPPVIPLANLSRSS